MGSCTRGWTEWQVNNLGKKVLQHNDAFLIFPISLGYEHCETVISILQLGKLRHRTAWCTSLSLGSNPPTFPGVPRVQLSKSNLSDPNPFQAHKANTTTGQHRELESEMKCFLRHPAPSAASLFFVSSAPPKERSTLAGFVLVCVYG